VGLEHSRMRRLPIRTESVATFATPRSVRKPVVAQKKKQKVYTMKP